jgi:hypothetical protein
MINISILTNNTAPNSRAFNTPLLVSRTLLKNKGLNLKFHFSLSTKLFSADILFVNSNFFRSYWQSDKKNQIFDLLKNAEQAKMKIVWFDTTDSTWCTQFEVLPYVDKFLKSHLLKEKKLYLKNYKTGRIFTDYFDKLYKSGEREENYPPADKKNIEKIGLSWNPCFERYNEKRYSFGRRLAHLLKPWTANIIQEAMKIEFTNPENKRHQEISARFGLTHSRPSVVDHRKAVAEILHKRGVQTSRIPLEKYFEEMRNSQISLSPFGVGEFCYRDYETIICGAALLKPDMSHLETWPNLYQENKTYIPHKWDLSDLNEKIDYLLENSESRTAIAENAQQFYKKTLSQEGMEEFAERIVKIVNH